MRSLLESTCRFCPQLLLAASLAVASGLACAVDDPIDLGTVSAGPRPASGGFGLPVSADTLLATTSSALSPGIPIDRAPMAPAATQSNSSALAASGVPVRVAITPMSASAATGLHAAISITLTSTSVSDATGQIVSVGYSVK